VLVIGSAVIGSAVTGVVGNAGDVGNTGNKV
jgi:hypothetical protein